MPKHYRPPGKKKEGNAAKYITRTKALKYLQVSLQDFRKICILKGVFPRVPKKKVEGNDKTYYHMKDIAFLAHEPILDTFRDIRAHGHKVNKALAKRNKPRAERLRARKPNYRLARIITERYPSFIDALRDLDDCLTLVHLFAALPAADSERINVKRIHHCRRLSHEWQAYISRTHSLRKAFIAVKGIVYEAVVQGQRITWITPHALQQVLSDDVDYNVMSTFLEFYEELLVFVNYKLYHTISVRYPPILDRRLEDLAEDLYALSRYFARSRVQPLAALEENSNQQENTEVVGSEGTKSNESELRLALLQTQLPANEPGALMQLVEEAGEDDEDIDEETRECKSLFKNLKFFLSREVQREALLFLIPAFGGVVSWQGEGAPFEDTDEGITHHIVDRPSQGHMFLSREYIQPQWVFDCVNARIIIPTEAYMVGKVCPPHLSPFVDNDAEGYTPDYAESIKQLVAKSKKEKMPLPLPGFEKDGDDPNNLLVQGLISRKEAVDAANKANEKKKQMDALQKQYHDELDNELRGVEYTASTIVNAVEENDESVPDPDEAAKDDEHMTQLSMSKKKRGLMEAIKIGKERKKNKVKVLEERKKKAEEEEKKKKKKKQKV